MWIYVAGFFKSTFSAILNHFQYGKDDQPSNLRVAHRPTKIPCRTGAKVSWAIKTCKETWRSSQKIDGHWTEKMGLFENGWTWPQTTTLLGKRMINHWKIWGTNGDHIWRQTHINTCFIFCHHVSRSLGSVWSSVQLFLLPHEVTLQGIDMTQLCNTFQWWISDFDDVFCQLESCQLTQLQGMKTSRLTWRMRATIGRTWSPLFSSWTVVTGLGP